MALKKDEWWMARGWPLYALSKLKLQVTDGGDWDDKNGGCIYLLPDDIVPLLPRNLRLAPGEGPIKVCIKITRVED